MTCAGLSFPWPCALGDRPGSRSPCRDVLRPNCECGLLAALCMLTCTCGSHFHLRLPTILPTQVMQKAIAELPPGSLEKAAAKK